MNMKKNPFKNLQLNNEEKQIEKDIAAGKYIIDPDSNRIITQIKQAIKNEKKDRMISLRLKNSQYLAIKKKAQETGVPYQSLLNVLINNYLNGKIQINL